MSTTTETSLTETPITETPGTESPSTESPSTATSSTGAVSSTASKINSALAAKLVLSTTKVKKKKEFQLKPAQVPFGKPGEARRLELGWQKFLNTRTPMTVSEYAQHRSVTDIEEIVPCLLCNSDTFLPLFHPRKKDWEYDVVMCSECQLVYRNPNIIPEHLHKLYDGVNYNNFLSGSYGGKQRQLKYKSVLYSFRDVMPLDGRTDAGPLKVLDFGCGNGLALEVLQDRGYTTCGVDLSPESVEAAKKRLGHGRLWCGDPEEISELKGEKFDFITMWSVLAHLPRPIETLSMLRSFLKPGGSMLVFTVNANSLLLKQDRDRWNGFTRNHLAFYSPDTANHLFKRSGFGEVYHRPHFSNHAGQTKKKLPAKVWQTWQLSILEHRGGNMNRMVAVNPARPHHERTTDGESQ